MHDFFHAVAIDYDGTLTTRERPDEAVLDAVRDVRAGGRKVILVTGRILAELRADFPDVDAHFDAIVAENGAVYSRAREGDQLLVGALPRELLDQLLARGVPARTGQVLVATDTPHESSVHDVLGELGLECLVERNRGALMILPAGVTKGWGVAAALADLNLSAHSAVAIADAENDHTLLDACEIGVAVSNAVDALKAHADIVLEEPDGAGVCQFLTEALPTGLPDVHNGRRRLTLGRLDDGSDASIPAARINILIHGPSGIGKSYVAAMLAKQWITQRYSVCMLDLEGDYLMLGALHGVVVLGGSRPLPLPEEVGALLVNGMTSVIIDLSLRSEEEKRTYTIALLDALNVTRRDSGLPHWIVVDEAHVSMPSGLDAWWCSDPSQSGICAITYRPDLLCRGVIARSAYRIALRTQREADLSIPGETTARRFEVSQMRVGHVRHAHKYTRGRLPRHRRFHFRGPQGLTGRTASNLPEFIAELAAAPRGVVRHHAGHGDFTRWLNDLCRDPALSATVLEIESSVTNGSGVQLDALRARLLDTVQRQMAALA